MGWGVSFIWDLAPVTTTMVLFTMMSLNELRSVRLQIFPDTSINEISAFSLHNIFLSRYKEITLSHTKQ